MRILMLSWEYPPRIVGGISRVVYDLAQKLGEKGNEVHVVTCMHKDAKEFEKDKNVYVHRVHTVGPDTKGDFLKQTLHMNFALTEKAVEVMDHIGKFDIIHAHDWLVAFAAKTLKHAYKIPMVCTIHATEHGRNNGIHNDMQQYIHDSEWWLTYESWKVICNSQYMQNEITGIWGLPREKTQIIFNGVDANKFDGIEKDMEFRRKYAMDNEKIVFFVGRMVREKGVHVLIDAIPKICQHYNDVKFVFAGKGPELDSLKSRAWATGYAHKTLFTGYISDEDLLKLYKCVDIAVFPSLVEPFGIVALEGMAADVPTVVSQAGGLGEIINHGYDGMKAYTGNANSLADCVLELLFNSDERNAEIRRNAMQKVRDLYNWDSIADQTYNVYKSVVEEAKTVVWENTELKNGVKELNDKKVIHTVVENTTESNKKSAKKSSSKTGKLQKIS